MTTGTKSNAKTSPDEAVKKAVADTPGATIEGIAKAAGIARSTAGKVLGRLAENKEVTRHKGGRDAGKRLPDRFTLTGTKMPPAYAAHVTPGSPAATAKQNGAAKAGTASKAKSSKAEGKRASGSAGKPGAAAGANGDRRLKAGGLEPLVLDYLKKNADSGPHGPSAVAKALERSSGAVTNCLTRLAKTKQIRRVTDKPQRYAPLT